MSVMPPSGISDRQNWSRPFFAGIAFFSAVVITAASFRAFRQINASPTSAWFNLACYGAAYLIPILFGWIGLRKIGAALFFILATGCMILDALVTRDGIFALFPLSYLSLLGLAHWVSKKRAEEMVIREIEIEKHNVEKNDLEMAFKEKGRSISVCF